MTKLVLFISALLVLVQPHAVAADVFVEKPYLQLGDSPKLSPQETMMVLWHAPNEDLDWRVEVRTAKDTGWRAAGKPAMQVVSAPGIAPHRVYRAQLTNLIPGEEFRYRVLKSGEPVFESSSRARKSATQAQHFVIFGDCAAGTKEERAVAYQTYQAKPDFVFITGDIVYSSGRISEYRDKFFPVYNADEASAKDGAPLIRSVPFIGAPGNHDSVLQNFQRYPDALAYFLYWDQPLNGPTGLTGAKTSHVLTGNETAQPAFLEAAKPRYPVMANFSFDYGNVHWTVLDSNTYMDWSDPGLQEWLVKDLASAKNATWRFVAFHHPGFNSAKSHFTDQWMRLLAPVFEEGKVDIVFAGHVHNYQRSFPLTFVPQPQKDGSKMGPKGEVAGEWTLDHDFADGKKSPHGVLYIVTGGGGAGLYNPEQQSDPSSWQPFTEKFFSEQHSYSIVDIDGKQLSFKQVSDTGNEVDSFHLKK